MTGAASGRNAATTTPPTPGASSVTRTRSWKTKARPCDALEPEKPDRYGDGRPLRRRALRRVRDHAVTGAELVDAHIEPRRREGLLRLVDVHSLDIRHRYLLRPCRHPHGHDLAGSDGRALGRRLAGDCSGGQRAVVVGDLIEAEAARLCS